MNKHLLPTITALIMVLPAFIMAQTGSGVFSVTGSGYSSTIVTDYQCVGINPANLGWKRNQHLMNVGAGNGEISVYSEPLKRQLVSDLFSSDEAFTPEEKEEAVRNFTGKKLQFEGNLNGLGISFQDENIGGFAFAVKERLFWDSNLNELTSDLLFKGYYSDYFDSLVVENGTTVGYTTNPAKVSLLFEDTHLDVLWYREFNLSYGRIIYGSERFSLYGGIGLKYIRGYSIFNYNYTGGGSINAYSALNPVLDVDYDTYSPSRIDGNDYQSVGNGFGADVGLTARIDDLSLSVSVTDIGQVKWNGNVYEGEDALLENIETSGMNNYNILLLDDNLAFDNLKWGGWKGLENKTVSLPGAFRAGAAYLLKERFEFGTDLFLPLNDVPGSYDKVLVGLGTRISPVKWLRGSLGIVTGGETGTSVPMGLSFFPVNNSSFTWEIGLAVRDITTYFSQEKPTVSLAFGVLRFSFGHLDTRQSIGTDTDAPADR
ncbi:MAG: hypothetical protein JW861_10490 [Bacteroidales bacterium]|nr:hypothetical protein [Bacteroidales bacterium]